MDGRPLGLQVADLQVQPTAVHAIARGGLSFRGHQPFEGQRLRIGGKLAHVGQRDAQVGDERLFLPLGEIVGDDVRRIDVDLVRAAVDLDCVELHVGLIGGQREFDVVHAIVGVRDPLDIGDDVCLQPVVERQVRRGWCVGRGRFGGGVFGQDFRRVEGKFDVGNNSLLRGQAEVLHAGFEI